jgi:REP element-mobilizing transposase RayT
MDGEMQLSDEGQIAAESWVWLGEQYIYVTLDAWVVMPNHTHAIITIHDDGTGGSDTGGSRTAPTATKRKPLGRLVGAFKTVSTKRINQTWDTPGARFWQRNYWEHIIRNEASYRRIYDYVEHNPARWKDDQLHPDAPPNPFNRG